MGILHAADLFLADNARIVGASNPGVNLLFELVVGAARAIDLGSFLNTGVANALRLTNRTVINPNTRALFRGVSLREFTFQFKMIAESQQEAAIVEQIVKHFRQQLYPETYDISVLGGASIGFNKDSQFNVFEQDGNLVFFRSVNGVINIIIGAGGSGFIDVATNDYEGVMQFNDGDGIEIYINQSN